MYTVVGCRDCGAFWIVADEPETTECPRCGTRRRFEELRAFFESDEEDAAREARGALLAERADEAEAFEDLADFASLEEQVGEPAVDDETYLSAGGADPEAAAEAGERATSGEGGGTSREATVRAALSDLAAPSEGEVVAYAEERGVPAEDARAILAKLSRAGEVVEEDGAYRPL